LVDLRVASKAGSWAVQKADQLVALLAALKVASKAGPKAVHSDAY